MIQPDKLAARFRDIAQDLDKSGTEAWQLVHDWQRNTKIPVDSIRGGGGIATELKDRAIERRVSQLHARLEQATEQALRAIDDIASVLADAHRPKNNNPGTDILASQAAADGWCRSCFRDDQHLSPIDKRPNGEPYYRDLCRWCGAWKADTGQLPSVEVLESRHAGRRIRKGA